MKKWMILLFVLFLFLPSMVNEKKEEEEEIRGVFISYIELGKYIRSHKKEDAMKNIDMMIENVKNLHLNTILLQVRSHSDAIYPSSIYPNSTHTSLIEGELDVLDYFIQKTHEKNMKVYAWINPYRVLGVEDVSLIPQESPAYPYLETPTLYVKNGVYFNPSQKEVKDLIVDGVKEVLNYPVDAVFFDDYFYPSADVDIKEYEEYIQTNGYLSLEDYHFQVINDLIQSVYQECHKKNVLFGVSPDGNIENNYLKHFADVKKWVQEKDYVDFIMPQVYYGFYNSTKAYTKVIREWESIIQNEDISLLIALAFYKVGMEDAYAKEGREEWMIKDDIIMREVLLSRNLKGYRGFSLFRYDSLFTEKKNNPNQMKEMKNLKKVIN